MAEFERMNNGPVLITGAGSGIGAAIAEAAAASGFSPLLLAGRTREKLEATAVACRGAGVEAAVYPVDIASEASVAGMAGAVREKHGTPAVLINNAGEFEPAPLLDMTVAHFDRQMAVNLRGAFLVTGAFLPDMVSRGSGLVVNIISTDALGARPGTLAYSVAKSGLLALTKGMREELRPHGIRVAGVLPGPTDTASWEGSGVPASCLMPPGEVAAAVLAVLRASPRAVLEEIVLRPPRSLS